MVSGSQRILLSSSLLVFFFLFLSLPTQSAAARSSTCKATVNFLGLSNVDVALRLKGSTDVLETKTNKKNKAQFTLDHETEYEVDITARDGKNGNIMMTRTEDLACRANNKGERVKDVRLINLVCTLTARFNGIRATVDVEGPEYESQRGTKSYRNKKNNKVVNLLRGNDYRLTISDQASVNAGTAMKVQRTFNCDSKRHTESEFTTRARVRTWKQKGFSLELRNPATNDLVYQKTVNKVKNRVDLYLLRGIYDAKLTRQGHTINETMDCSSGAMCKWTDTTARLVVKFPKMGKVNVEVRDMSDAVQFSANTRTNNVVTHLLRGTYKVTVASKNGAVNYQENVVCDSSQCSVSDFTSLLNIRFQNVKLDKIEVFHSSDLATPVISSKNVKNKFQPHVVRGEEYNVVLTKAGHSITETVTCNAARCKLQGFTTRVKIHFNGIGRARVLVKNTETDQVVFDKNRKTGLHFWTLKQNLTTTISKNGASMSKSVDCGTHCKFTGFTTTIATRFHGLKNVKVQVRVPDTSDVVISRKRHGNAQLRVLRGEYDIDYIWKGQTKTVRADCSSTSTNWCKQERVSTKLVVRFHGMRGVRTEVFKGADRVLKHTRHNYYAVWVLRDSYDVKLTKNKVVLDRAVNCTELTRCLIKDTTTRVVARFPGVKKVKVTISKDGELVHKRNNRNYRYAFRVLRGSGFSILLQKNAASYEQTDIDLSSATKVVVKDIVGRVVARFPGQRKVKVELRTYDAEDPNNTSLQGLVVRARRRNNRYRFKMLCGEYKLYLNNEYDRDVSITCPDGVSVTEARDDPEPTPQVLPAPATPVPATDATSIEFTGLVNVTNLAIQATHTTEDDHTLYRPANITGNYLLDQQTLEGTWERNLTQGAVTVTDDFTTTAGAAYTEDLSGLFATLTVSVGTALGDNVDIAVADPDIAEDEGDSDLVTVEEVSGDVVVKVLRGTWDVVIYDGQSNYTVEDVDCTGATCSVASSSFICEVTVEHANVNVTRIALSNDDEDSVGVEGDESGTTVFTALYGDYTLYIDNNAAQYTGSFSCNTPTTTVNSLTSVMTVNFDGVSGVAAEVLMDDGFVHKEVDLDDSVDVTLLRLADPYDVELSATGVNTTTTGVDCSGASCTVEGGTALNITVGLDNVRATVTAVAPAGDGAQEAEEEVFDYNHEMKLLRAVYDLRIEWDSDASDATFVERNGVDCTAAACSADGFTSELTTKFTGLTDVNVEVQALSGDTMAQTTDATNSATHTVLAFDGYKVQVQWKGINHTSDAVDASSDVEHEMACTLNALYTGRKLVDVIVRDSETEIIVGQAEGTNDTSSWVVLCDRTYDIDLSGAGYPYGQLRPDVAADAATVDVLPLADPEMTALKALYDTCNGPNWTRKDDWATEFSLDGTPVCLSADKDVDTAPFPGVVCRTGVVKEIILDWNMLACDRLPTELTQLEFLQVLNLEGNAVHGLSTNFDEFAHIKTLNMAFNSMTGDLPDLSHLALSLQRLELNDNQFSGEIPETMNLPFIKYLHLQNNDLSGELPNLNNVTEMMELLLNDNELEGDLPEEMFAVMQQLRTLWLQNNMFTGPLPQSLGEWAHIVTIDVSNNNFEGGVGNLELLTTLSALKTDGNPSMTEEAQCSTSEDGSQECTTVAVSDSESAAGIVHPALATVLVAALSIAFFTL